MTDKPATTKAMPQDEKPAKDAFERWKRDKASWPHNAKNSWAQFGPMWTDAYRRGHADALKAERERCAEIAMAYRHIPPYSDDVKAIAIYQDKTCELIAQAIRTTAAHEIAKMREEEK